MSNWFKVGLFVFLLNWIFFFSNRTVNTWNEDIMTAPPTNGVPICCKDNDNLFFDPSFVVTDYTADRIITFPDISGVIITEEEYNKFIKLTNNQTD